MTTDSGFIKGEITVRLVDEDGNVKTEYTKPNTITTSGRDMWVNLLTTTPSRTKPTHMAVGTGTATATAMQTELDRNALGTTTSSGNVVTYTGTWAAGDPTGTPTLTEVGLFDAASGGNTLATAALNPSVAKGTGDTLTVTWTWTLTV